MKRGVAYGCCGCWLLFAFAACASLDEMELDVCGNRVLDPGEDCDGALGCAEPGANSACRYICTFGAEDPGCPESFTCGVSGVCAQPGDGLQLAAELARGGDGVVNADFDADSVSDVAIASASQRRLDVLFLARDLSIEDEFEFPIDSATMSVGSIDQDASPDILIPSEAALFSLSTRAGERSLVGAAFTPSGYVFSNTEGRVVALPARAIPAVDGQPDVLQPDASVEGVLVNFPGDEENTALYGINPYQLQQTPIATLAERIPLASTVLLHAPLVPRTEACDEQVILRRDASAALVILPCEEPGVPRDESCPPGDAIPVLACTFEIDLAGSVQAASVLQLDPEAAPDAELEILVLIGEPGEAPSELRVLERQQAYTFQDVAPEARWLEALHGVVGAKDQAVLLMADINQDQAPDFVRADGVYLSDMNVPFDDDPLTPSYYRAGTPSASGGWAEVALGDFDANGLLDVVAAAGGAGDDLDLLMNSGLSYFNPRSLPASGTPAALTVGDLDGDGAADLVLRERSESTAAELPACSSPDEIVVRFGGPLGLEERRGVARVAGVEQMTAGRLARLDKRDSIDDFGVASRCEPGAGEPPRLSFGVFYGASNRQIAAPYRLIDLFEEFALDTDPDVLVPYVPEAFAVSTRSKTTLAMAGRLFLGDVDANVYELALFALEGFEDELSSKHIIPLRGDQHPQIEASMVRVAIGDLDGSESDGLEEIAIVDPLHLHVVDAWQEFRNQSEKLALPANTHLLDEIRTTPLELEGKVVIEAALAHDIDGDGAEELFVVGATEAGPLLRYYSDLDAQPATPHDVAVPAGKRVVGIAFLPRHDGSSADDVVIAVSGEGALSYRWDGAALVLSDFSAELTAIRALAVGDVDGDQFADLVLVAADRTRIYTRRQRFLGGDPLSSAGGTP